MHFPTLIFMIILNFSSILASDEEIVTFLENEPHDHTQDTVSVRLVFPNATKAVQVSPEFIKFLQKDLQSLREEFKGGSCTRRCQDTLFYIRRIQKEYEYRSLYQLYYFLSITRDCFCYDTGFLDSDDGTSVNFEWDVDIHFRGEQSNKNQQHQVDNASRIVHSHNNNGNDGYHENGNNNNRCSWENLIYWLVKLIGAGVYDLRREDLKDVCHEYICHHY